MNEMKKILLIGTGGTIASDVTDSGLAPELTTEQLLSHIPEKSFFQEKTRRTFSASF